MLDILAKRGILSKERVAALITPAIVFFVGIGAFGLGRLSALPAQKGALIIHPPGSTTTLAQPAGTPMQGQAGTVPVNAGQEKNFVASKSGTKYYAATCAGASRIKAENEVWFATAAAAVAAGYEPAANCSSN